MAINLATLDVALRSVGGEKVAADLDKVEARGKRTGRTMDGLGASGTRAKRGMDQAAAGASNLGATVARLARSAEGARVMTRRIRELTAGVQIAGTRAASLERLRLIETQLTAALAQGNLTIQQRVVLERQLTATRAGLASTTQAAAGAERSMSTLGATLRTLGFSIAAFSVARLVGGLFDAATMAEETASKFETTMGESSASVRAFLAEFGPMAGLSRTVGEEMTATAAAIVQGMGMSQQASARFSRQIIQTAGDLQSFHNVPIEETFRALRAGIVGEYEPLRRLGIVLTEATVKQRALSDSGKEHADQLTQSELATTRLTMAIERMGVANGDLERTQDATQNQARRTRAEMENLRIELAQYLSGAFASAVASGAGLVRLLARNGPLIAGMAAATVTIGALTLAVKAYAFATGVSAVTGTTRFIAALTALRVAALNPVVIGVTAVAVAVGGLVTMLLRARQRADEQREAMAALAATTRDSRDALREYQDAQAALDRLPAAASADERRAAYDRQQASIRALMALGPDYQRAIEDEILKQGDLAAAIQGVTDKRNADLKAAALQADQALMDAVRARENAQAALGRSGAYDTQRVLDAAMEAEAEAVDHAAESWRNYARAIGLLDVPEPEGGTGAEGPDTAELRKIAEARAQELIAAAERERAIQGATHDKARAIDDAAHAEGLRSLDTYYGNRRQLMEAEAQKEIATLEVQRSALASLTPEDEAGRIRQRTQLADIENRITVRQIVLERERAQLAAQEGQARTQLAAKIVDAEREVQAAQGRTREIALASIERQAESYDALLRQQGRSVEERERLVAAYREPLIAKVEFDEAEREAKRVLAEIELARTRIRQQVEQGLLTEAEGQRQLAELEKARLPQLEALADAMEAFAAALGNPDLAAAAARFRAELGSLGATAEGLGERMGRAMVTGFAAAWGDGFEALGRDGSLTSGMEAFGNALLSGFGSALQSFGEAVVVASGLMEAVVAAFSSLNPVAMAGAGFALIAIGGMLKGAASRSMGRGGSSARAPVGPVDTTHQVTLGSRSSGNAAQRTAPASGSSAQTAALTTGTVRPVDTASLVKPPPAVNINNPIFASPYDSTWQRNLTATIKQATRNGAL